MNVANISRYEQFMITL